MALTVTASLTPSGKVRLQNIMKKLNVDVSKELNKSIKKLKTTAASFAPSPTEEAYMLSAGVAADGTKAGQTVGKPDGGRFFRDGVMIPLREAIERAPVTERLEGGTILLSTASAAWINARTGFSWFTKRRGLQGPTLPFNRAYVQTLENGGAVWIVVPRERDYYSQNFDDIFGTVRASVLNPEPGIYTSEMVKTLQPRGMFRQARAAARPAVESSLRAACKRAAKTR